MNDLNNGKLILSVGLPDQNIFYFAVSYGNEKLILRKYVYFHPKNKLPSLKIEDFNI